MPGLLETSRRSGRIVLVVLLALGVADAASRASARRALGRPERTMPRRTIGESVEIHVAPPRGGHRYRAEAAGHAAVLVEAALADLAGWTTQIVGAPLRPSMRVAAEAPPPWRLELEARVGEPTLLLDARLCPPARGRCRTFSAEGPRLRPEVAAARIARDMAASFGRTLSPAPPEGPASDDPYAVLLLGRAAATVIGLLPPPPGLIEGDPHTDPVERAVFIDPGMDLGWVLRARAATLPEAAARALARVERPRPADLADLAAVLGRADRPVDAWRAWAAYDRVRTGDPRFAAARAAAAARAGEDGAVLDALAAVPVEIAADPAVSVRVEVALAERAGSVPDALLSEWQRLAPDDPRPVRRRIAQHLEAERLADALRLTPALAERGAAEEAHRLTLALATHLGDTERAARAAGHLGRDEVARRLQLKGEGPRSPALLEGMTSPEARLRRAETELEALAPQRALDEVHVLLAERSWWPAALDLERRAWAALGARKRAEAAEARVRHVDPLARLHPEPEPEQLTAALRPDPIAPSIADLDESHRRLTRLLDAADAADATWSEAQRAWVDADCPRWRCQAEIGAPLAARLGAASRSARRFAQSARAEWTRAERIARFEAVRPLVRERREHLRSELQEQVERASARYAARRAWDVRFVDRWARAYGAQVEASACEARR